MEGLREVLLFSGAILTTYAYFDLFRNYNRTKSLLLEYETGHGDKEAVKFAEGLLQEFYSTIDRILFYPDRRAASDFIKERQ